ncbi:hypothetical protein ACJU29_12920, partial [Pseudomonas aeruginosa]
MRSLTLIPLLTSCIISPLCASQPFPNTQVTDGQLLARDFNRGGHSHVQKRANKLHNHAGKRQIRVHNYANEAVPFIVHGKKGRPQKLSATPDHFGKVLPHVLSRTQRHRARHDPDR